MRLSTIIISLLLIGAVFAGMYSFVNQMAADDYYDVEVKGEYEASFDKTNNLSVEINEQYATMSNWSASKSTSVQIITLVPDSLALALDIIKLPFTIIGELISSLLTLVGLPVWFTTMALAVVAVVLIFGIIALILRYRDT